MVCSVVGSNKRIKQFCYQNNLIRHAYIAWMKQEDRDVVPSFEVGYKALLNTTNLLSI